MPLTILTIYSSPGLASIQPDVATLVTIKSGTTTERGVIVEYPESQSLVQHFAFMGLRLLCFDCFPFVSLLSSCHVSRTLVMLNLQWSQQPGCSSWFDALLWCKCTVPFRVRILSSAFPLQSCRIAALISCFVASIVVLAVNPFYEFEQDAMCDDLDSTSRVQSKAPRGAVTPALTIRGVCF